jgi:hypothetical protein
VKTEEEEEHPCFSSNHLHHHLLPYESTFMRELVWFLKPFLMFGGKYLMPLAIGFVVIGCL